MGSKRRRVGTAVFALMAGLMLAVTPPVGAQNDFSDSIFLQVFNCPPGMTADTLVAGDCTPATAGFDVRIVSMEGIAEPLRLADAMADVSPDGSHYFVFGDELVNQRGLTGRLRIEETVLPDGYTSYVVLGASPAPDGSGYDFDNTLDADAPDPLLTVYNFAPADDGSGGTGATVIVRKAECPAGYDGGDLFADCHGPRVAGVTFGFLIGAPGARRFTETDGDGVAVFETSQGALGLGLSITEEPPYDIAEYVVSCTTGAGNPVDLNYDGANVGVVLTATNNFTGVSEVVCDWYNIPVASAGDDGDTGVEDSTGEDVTEEAGDDGAEIRGPVVEVDIDEDGIGTITFDLDGDGTVDFTINVGQEPAFTR